MFIDKEVSASGAAGRGPRLLAHVVGPAKDQPLPKLERFWPGPIGLFAEITTRSRQRSWRVAPSPADVRRLGAQASGHVLAAPPVPQPAGAGATPSGCAQLLPDVLAKIEMRTRRTIVLHRTCTLEVIVEQIAELELKIAQALGEAPRWRDFSRLPPLARRRDLGRDAALGDR